MRRLAPLAALLFAALHAQTVELCCSVTVSVRTADGRPIPDAAVQVVSGAMRYEARTAASGEAVIPLRTAGEYRATAVVEGHPAQTREFRVGRDETARVELTLSRRDSIDVQDRTSPLDPAQATSGATRDQVRSLPERVADVRNALPLLPGVVRTPEGKLQIAGSPEYRSTFLVNSLDVTDPATGGFGATVPIDVIETLQVYKSPFLAEYGHFSAAVVAVTTRRGGDKWHYELNDPTPEFRIRSAHLHGIRGFTPRFAATGPVVRGKLFFAGAGSFELRKTPVYPLPFPYNEEKTQRVNAYAQFDFVPRPTHLLTGSIHAVPDRAAYMNLDFYTPQTAAPSARGRESRASLADRLETRRGMFESAVSISELTNRTWGQGDQPLKFTPVTTPGNYFLIQDWRARRVQLVETWSRKDLKIGASLARATLDGSASAHDVFVAQTDSTPLVAIPYRNRAPYGIADWDGSLFVQDAWEPVKLIRIDAGLRLDRQSVSGVTTAAPRIGIAWTPAESARTVLRGGFGWFYDRVPLNAFAFPSFPERSGLPNELANNGRFSPHSRTLSAAIERRAGQSLLLHAGYIHSESSDLLIVLPEPDRTLLAGSGRARTSELELTAKFTWYAEQSWILSYTHTLARGDLNTADTFLGSFPDPLLRTNEFATLPATIPHRFLTWGVFPLRYGLRFSPVVEWRNGFPYSVLNEYQQYAGVPNAHRLPAFFSLDTRLSKDIAYRGHKVRVAFSMFNVTDHANYDAIRLNTADPQLGEVLGRRPRRFRLDFDWLF